MNSDKHGARLALTLAIVTLLAACAPLAERHRPGPDSGRRAEEVLAQRAGNRNEHGGGSGASGAAAARQQAALREGIKLYDDGDFNGAIRRLASAEAAGDNLAARLTALKYTAFSYCVTGRPLPCRAAFDKALRLDPGFDLAPGEHSHPLWGPVFAKAKKDN